jgi:hypothetical protein
VSRDGFDHDTTGLGLLFQMNPFGSIGEHTIDLRAEVIIKDDSELLGLLEMVKAMESVRDAIWSEVVDVISRKSSIPSSVIDKL